MTLLKRRRLTHCVNRWEQNPKTPILKFYFDFYYIKKKKPFKL